MDFKQFWKNSWAALIVRHFLLAAIILFIIIFITLKGLDIYTHHGEAERVPDLRGKYTEEAEILLASQGLTYQIIDSTYIRKQPQGIITEQTPEPGSFLKKGRPVYIIINKKAEQKSLLPNIIDLSYRQAEAMLKIAHLQINEIIYEPSEFKDLVLDVRLNGESIAIGTQLPEETAVDLVIGEGIGQEMVYAPLLIRKNLTDIRNELLEIGLVVGAINYDVNPDGDEDTYYVYQQSPEAGQQIASGSRIDLWMSKDKNKTADSKQEEEDFF
jgi:beta-lactam-binding protein with PASTA domain